MGYMTKYGSFWGVIPVTSGKTIWVAPSASYTVEGRSYSASDNNDGLSPERAVLTLDYAIGLCTANVGDVIVLLPGAHSWSATVAVDVAGITITGLPRGVHNGGKNVKGAGMGRNVCSVTTTASAHILTVTASDVEIAYLHFIPASGYSAVDGSAAATAINVHDCTFNMTTTGATATIGISASGVINLARVANCYWYVVGNQGPAIRTAVGLTNSIVENCTFQLDGSTAWDDVIEITTGTENLTIRDCDFMSGTGAVMTDVIDMTGNTTDAEVTVMRCYFPVGSDPLEQSATGDYQIVQLWLAQVGSLTGGTAVTA